VISKQQLRLLILFVFAFGVLTVPVILILINFVPSNAAGQTDVVVIEGKVAKDAIREIDASYSTISSDNSIANSTEISPATKTTNRSNNTPLARAFIAGNWVVVDCGRRLVVQCPHRLIHTGTSPRFSETNRVFQSHCRDVSINLDSFCRL